MIRMISLFILLGCFISSCDNTKEEILNVETLEVFDMEKQEDGYVPKNLNYSEKSYHNKKGKLIKKEFLDVSRKLKGTEYYDYINTENYSSSRYISPDGILLSKYSFEYDQNGLMTKKMGYDGTTDELLRIETYRYDSRGHRTLKEIRDDQGNFQGAYTFTVDAYGNELSLEIKNDKNQPILKESYKIVKYNDQKEWLESTGFRNDIPTTFKRRTFE